MKKVIIVSYIYRLLLVCIYLVSGCNQNALNPKGCLDFKDLPKSTDGYRYVNVQRYTEWVHSVHFNPNNTSELVAFLINTNTPLIRKLVTYNILTKQVSLLVEGNLGGVPRWGRENWILFNSGSNIYKINPKSNDLVQITSQGSNHEGCWSYDGQKIAYLSWQNQSGGGQAGYLVIGNQDNPIIDSIKTNFSGCWAGDSFLINVISNKIDVYDYPKLTLIKQIDPNVSTNLTSIDWLPLTKNVIWTCSKGIFKTDLDTGQTMCIKSSCETKAYGYISVAPDGKKMLSVALHHEKNNKAKTVESYDKLYIMNIDGTNEEEIVLSN